MTIGLSSRLAGLGCPTHLKPLFDFCSSKPELRYRISFRFKVAFDTIVLRYYFRSSRCIRDFHPLVYHHARHTIKKAEGLFFRFSGFILDKIIFSYLLRQLQLQSYLLYHQPLHQFEEHELAFSFLIIQDQ